MRKHKNWPDRPTSMQHLVLLPEVEKNSLLYRVPLPFAASIVTLCIVACTSVGRGSTTLNPIITMPPNRGAAWVKADYATCLYAAGGEMHGELHVFSACMTSRGYRVDFYNKYGTLVDINSVQTAYYYPFESVEQFISQYPAAQNHAYSSPDSNVVQTPPAPPEQVTTPQQPSNQIASPSSPGNKPSWQQMFPDSTLGRGVESLSGAELRLLNAVRAHPVRLLKVAHPEATPEKSGTHVERDGSGNPVIVDDIMWSKDGLYYGTTFKLTLLRTSPAKLDSVAVDVQEINNPWPGAFFYPEATKKIIIGWLLAEYSVPTRIFGATGDVLSVKIGLGIILCYVANNP
jgi:hypothetical protein